MTGRPSQVPLDSPKWISPNEVEAIAAAVAARLVAAPQPLVDAEQAAAVLAVDASWLLKRARLGDVPHRRLGRYVRFDVAELLRWAATSAAHGPGPVTGTDPVTNGPEGQRSSGADVHSLPKVPSVVPRRAA